MLTRKHFNALAVICADFQENPEHEELTQALAVFCAEHGSPNFDRQRFLRACGLPEGNSSRQARK